MKMLAGMSAGRSDRICLKGAWLPAEPPMTMTSFLAIWPRFSERSERKGPTFQQQWERGPGRLSPNRPPSARLRRLPFVLQQHQLAMRAMLHQGCLEFRQQLLRNFGRIFPAPQPGDDLLLAAHVALA